MSPFLDRPAVVAAFLHAIDHLPQLPADIADPEIAGGPIEAHAPGVAKSVGINLRPSLRDADERVVRRNRVRLAAFGAIDVDAQDRRQQIADVLARIQSVGRVGIAAIAGRDLENANGDTEISHEEGVDLKTKKIRVEKTERDCPYKQMKEKPQILQRTPTSLVNLLHCHLPRQGFQKRGICSQHELEVPTFHQQNCD